MKLCDMKVGDVITYPDLFKGTPSAVTLTLDSLSSDGKVREGIFSARVLGLRVGTVTARESGSQTKWTGVVA